MPAKVLRRFFIVSSPSGPSSAAGSIASLSLSPSLGSFLSLGSSGAFFTADVALLAAETDDVSEAAGNIVDLFCVVFLGLTLFQAVLSFTLRKTFQGLQATRNLKHGNEKNRGHTHQG